MTIKTPEELKKSQAQLVVSQWPAKRMSQGLGLSFKDGFYFFIGAGVATVFVMPIIILAASCIIWVLLLVFGNWLGSML